MSAVQRGQVVVIFALMLSGLAAISALGLDALQLLAQRRALQGAADLAALAGGQELWTTENASAATQVALFVATANGYTTGTNGVTVAVVTPYKDDPSSIEVTIHQAANTLFLRVLGVASVEVMGRAVGSPSGYTIFAGASDCADLKTIDVTTSGTNITGRVHSNGSMKVNGSDNRLGIATRHCSAQVGGSNNRFPGAQPQAVGKRPWPISYTAADFPCTFTFAGNVKLDTEPAVWLDWPARTKLRPGVYCSSGDLQLSGSGVSGNVTLVAAGQIQFAGPNYNLTAYMRDILAFSTAGGTAVQITGAAVDGQWTGVLYAPNGEVQISGARSQTSKGAIVAARVDLAAANLALSGSVGPPGGLLVE